MRQKQTMHEPRDEKAVLFFVGFMALWTVVFNVIAIIADGRPSWVTIAASSAVIAIMLVYRKKVILPALKNSEEQNAGTH